MSAEAAKIIGQRVDDITKIDVDRAQSLLEAIQGVVVSFVVGVIMAHYIDGLFPSYSPEESDMDSLKFGSLQLAANIIAVIYIGKIVSLVPFAFNLTGRTTLGGKESGTALGFAMSIVFVSTQSNFLKRVGRARSMITSKLP